MERKRLLVKCPENEELADFMLSKWEDLASQKPKGISEKVDNSLSKAYSSLCKNKEPVRTIKDFSQIKGVGKWILKLMQGFFKADSSVCEPEELINNGKKPRRYLPQKNSVPYALLITLYRATSTGKEFMLKQELIDAAEASGLSRVPIAPELGKGKAGGFGGSPRDWYSGWTSMKTLISKALVVKSSCPAKYMLTQEGKEAARDCIKRSGLPDTSNDGFVSDMVYDLGTDETSDVEILKPHKDVEMTASSGDSGRKKSKVTPSSYTELPDLVREVTPSSSNFGKNKPTDMPIEHMERLMKMGYSKERITKAYCEVTKSSTCEGSSWLTILCRLREDEVYGSESQTTIKETPIMSTQFNTTGETRGSSSSNNGNMPKFNSVDCMPSSSVLGARSSSAQKSSSDREVGSSMLAMPPLSSCERFEDVYEVVLILDNREQFAKKGSRSNNIIESVSSHFKIKIEVRQLPVGDCIWIARHNIRRTEYVLDFIVERKKVDDLRSSIRDNRYRDQKLRLLRCGLQKLIYVVEGDPNASEAAESIKTACLTTEILEGFDVQRTSGLGDTLKKYGFLTQAIAQCYKSQTPEEQHRTTHRVCPSFREFIKKCEELDKMTVNDLFAIQLMQVPQVTEEIALAVTDLYPTIISLANAYSLLDGDVAAQQEMLRSQSNNVVSIAASRNIHQLVWGD